MGGIDEGKSLVIGILDIAGTGFVKNYISAALFVGFITSFALLLAIIDEPTDFAKDAGIPIASAIAASWLTCLSTDTCVDRELLDDVDPKFLE